MSALTFQVYLKETCTAPSLLREKRDSQDAFFAFSTFTCRYTFHSNVFGSLVSPVKIHSHWQWTLLVHHVHYHHIPSPLPVQIWKIKTVSCVFEAAYMFFRRQRRRFLIELLVILCVRGQPGMIQAREIDKWCCRCIGSKSAPSWNIMSNMSCAILKRHNSMFALQINLTMQKFCRRGLFE